MGRKETQSKSWTMKKGATLSISREDLCDAITFWLNNSQMKNPVRCTAVYSDHDPQTQFEIEIEPIQFDRAEPIHLKEKEYSLWLEQHGIY